MSTSTTGTANQATARCVALASVFHDQLLEEPLPVSAPAAVRRRQLGLIAAAQRACRACPLIVDCLYRAVVEYDVAGYAAGTTPPQRAEIRSRLDVMVQPEDLDTLAGVTGRNRQVNHDEVVSLRNANPHESLETLARRLGCSLSTVKRHLRRERREATWGVVVAARPTVEEVLTAAAEVTGSPVVRRRFQAA